MSEIEELPKLTIFGEVCEPHDVGDWVRWVAQVWPFVGTVHRHTKRHGFIYRWEISYDHMPKGYNQFGRGDSAISGEAPTLLKAAHDLNTEARCRWRRAQAVFG